MKKIKRITLMLVISLTIIISVSTSEAAKINFSEVILPSLTLLDGTNYYTPYGISFTDTTYYAVDGRFAEDGYGITTTGGTDNLTSVIFTNPVNSLDFTWVTIESNDLYATAYDGANNVIDSLYITGLIGTTTDTATLSGSGIVKVTWHDGAGTIGIDSITFGAVPEPATMLLLGLGLVGLTGIMRKIKK